MVDTSALGADAARREGSSPFIPTKYNGASRRESSSPSRRTIIKEILMDYYNKFQKDNREAIISFVDDEYLMCSFFEDNQIVGRIEYPDKSRHYVTDAAENWITRVMTVETVKNYTKQLDLFSK